VNVTRSRGKSVVVASGLAGCPKIVLSKNVAVLKDDFGGRIRLHSKMLNLV